MSAQILASSPRWRIVGKREIFTEGVDPDRQGIVEEVGDKRRWKKQQKTAAAAVSGRVRSTGLVDRRARRAQARERSTEKPDCKQPNSRVFWVDRWVDRKRRSVDRAVDRQTGLGVNLLLRRFGYLRLFLVSKVCKQSQRLWEKKGYISLAFKEVASKL